MNIPIQSRNGVAWREARLARDLSLRKAAKKAEIDPAQLSRVERGLSNLSGASMLRLARVLHLRALQRQLERFVASDVTDDAKRPADAAESKSKQP